MEGPGGSRTVIEGGASTWTGPWEDPYRANYAFTVTNEGVDTETVHTAAYNRHHAGTNAWLLKGPLQSLIDGEPGRSTALWLKGKC